MEQLEYIKSLYNQFLAQTISESDRLELDSFFKSANDQELDYVIGKLDPDHKSPESILRQYDESSEEILTSIRQITLRDTKPKTFPFRKYITVAAALITFAFIGYYLYKSYNPISNQEQLNNVNNDDIAPGGNRATITLSDGTVLELDEKQSGIVASGTELAYADGQKLLEADKDIQFATMTTPRGGQYQITLPDGTKAWLNAASSLRYPSRFNDNERKVTLEGEAYFEVAPDKEHPFIVESNGQSVEVLGTGFNVNAYGDEPQSLTTLSHGSIRINTADESKSIILKPGEQAAVAGKNIKVKQVEVDEYTAWRKGKISLSQTDLSGIIRQIERWYDVQFDIDYLPPSEPMFGVVKRDVQLSELLQALELHYNVKFTRNGRRITMSK